MLYNSYFPYYNNYSYHYRNYYNPNNYTNNGITPKELCEINDKTTYISDNHDVNENSNIERERFENSQEQELNFKIGPIEYRNKKFSIYNFSFEIDDLIIIAIIILLLLDGSCNYITIIVLGLLLFNIKIPMLNIFS